MKVCVITPWYPDRAYPFAGIFVQQQVNALRAAGVEVAVEVAMAHPTPSEHRIDRSLRLIERLATRDPATVYGSDEAVSYVPTLQADRIGFAGRADAFRKSLEIRRRVQALEADVVHAHVVLPAGHAALATSGDIPVVVTEHFTGLSRVLVQNDAAEMYRNVADNSAHLAFVSSSLRQVFLDRFGDTNSPVHLTPNIVDLAGVPFRVRTGPLDRWLYVGNLTEVKGIDLLLEAFARYRSKSPDAGLVIVGDGPKREWVEQFTARRGLANAVRLVGSVEHSSIGSYFDDADVLVHLSSIETFGISTMEAIGAGIPVVNLDNGAAREVWGEIEESVGRILPLDASAEQVASTVESLAHRKLDPRLGRDFVVTRYSSATVASHLLSVYGGLL